MTAENLSHQNNACNPILDSRYVQSGVAILDGVVVCGLYRTTKVMDEDGHLRLEPERVAGTLVVHRTKSGVQILRTKRNGMYVNGRRLRRFEDEHNVEIKLLSLPVVEPFAHKVYGKPWLELTREQRWEVSAAIAESLRYKAVDEDLPRFIRSTAPLLPAPTNPARSIPIEPKPAPTATAAECGMLAFFGAIVLLVLMLALLRGAQIAFGATFAAIAAYSSLAYAIIHNRRRAATGSSDDVF